MRQPTLSRRRKFYPYSLSSNALREVLVDNLLPLEEITTFRFFPDKATVKVESLCARFIQLQIPPYCLSPALRRVITWLSGMLSPLPLLPSRHLPRKRYLFRPKEGSSGCSLVKDFLTYGLSCLIVIHRLLV